MILAYLTWRNIAKLGALNLKVKAFFALSVKRMKILVTSENKDAPSTLYDSVVVIK